MIKGAIDMKSAQPPFAYHPRAWDTYNRLVPTARQHYPASFRMCILPTGKLVAIHPNYAWLVDTARRIFGDEDPLILPVGGESRETPVHLDPMYGDDELYTREDFRPEGPAHRRHEMVY